MNSGNQSANTFVAVVAPALINDNIIMVIWHNIFYALTI